MVNLCILVAGNKCIIIHNYNFIIIYFYSPDGVIVSLCILREVIMDLCYTMSGFIACLFSDYHE